MNLSISAVIPVYNGARFLNEAVDSILQQTHPVQEIVLVDDGSKDDSFAIMEKIAASSPIPVKICQQQNSGVSAARNLGLMNASSTLIAFLDVDDLWLPTKIEKQISIYERYATDTAYTFTDYYLDDETKRKLANSEFYQVCLSTAFDKLAFQKAFISENFIGTASTNIFNREIALKIGGFNARLNHSEDFDFVLRYSQHAEIRLFDEALLVKRTHGENLTGNPKLHYWSHMAALSNNVLLDSQYTRFNYAHEIKQKMRYSYDLYMIKLGNEIYEESFVKGLKFLFSSILRAKSLGGSFEIFKAIIRKIIRTCSFGLIKRR